MYPQSIIDAIRATNDGKLVLPKRGIVQLPNATLFKTTDGYLPEPRVIGPIEVHPQLTPVLALFRPPIPTDAGQISYFEEPADLYPMDTGQIQLDVVKVTTEGGAKEDSNFGTYARKTLPMTTMRANVRCTEEVLEDEAQLETLLSDRLTQLAHRTLDRNIVAAAGTFNGLTGTSKEALVNNAGLLTYRSTDTAEDNTIPADPANDILAAALKLEQDTSTSATGVIVNSTRWYDIASMRDSTGSLANPTTMFGGQQYLAHAALPIGTSNDMKDGKKADEAWALVGDFARGADIYTRQGVVVETGRSIRTARDNTVTGDFEEYAIVLRVAFQAQIAWRRPSSFCQIKTAEANG